MTMEQAISLINTVGFPIAMVGFLLWYVQGFTKRIMDENNVREEEHRAFQVKIISEMNAMAGTLLKVSASLDRACQQSINFSELRTEENRVTNQNIEDK